MNKITGKILEHSSYTIEEAHCHIIGEVRIEGDDGTIYAVKNAAVDPRLNNALNPGNRGTFYFHKTLFRRNILLAAEFNGVTVFGEISPVRFLINGIILMIVGIPALPLLGFGIIPMMVGGVFISGAIQIFKLRAELEQTGAAIQRFKTV